MAQVDDILAEMRQNPKGIRFRDLCQVCDFFFGAARQTVCPDCGKPTLIKVCDFFFGAARQTGSSHRVYKTPWQGDPRVNIQEHQGRAKPYQVRQVLKAIERLEADHDSNT